MDKALAAKLHARAGNMPETWRSCAADLLAAASVLLVNRASMQCNSEPTNDAWRTHPSELMLRGMAIECLLKALWITQGHKLVEDNKYIGVPGAADHDLVQLAKALQMQLSDFEKDLLSASVPFHRIRGPVSRAQKCSEVAIHQESTRGSRECNHLGNAKRSTSFRQGSRAIAAASR
jgi:hypothetical protein